MKLAAIAAFLCLNLAAGSVMVSGAIAISTVILMISGRVPYRRQLLMIAFPSTFALFVVATQTVFSGSSVLASLGPLDLHRDGLLHGLFLSLRIVAGGLIVVLLGVSTPLNRLCLALRWYRVPQTFVEIMQLTYRYLFDIHAEFFRMHEAQKSRLGWSSATNGLASSRMLGGSLFLRVYEQGERSAEAMRCRGAGPLVAGSLPAPGRLDAAAGAICLPLFVLLLVLAIAGPLA